MTRHILGSSLVAIALSMAAIAGVARGQSNDDFPPVSNNAALQYWQAFGMLPAFDADQEKLLENWETAPIDDAAIKLLDASKTSLMFLKRAAKMPNCDWGLDYRDGVSLYLPHLAKSRTLARVAALDARRAFEEGRFDNARDDAFAMMALAHQVGSDSTLISFLVAYAIEGMVVNTVAPYLPEVKAPYADAVAGFKSLPPTARLDVALRGERYMTLGIVEQLKKAEAERPESWREIWLSLASPDVPAPIKKVKTLDEALKLTQDYQSVHDELVAIVKLPPSEFDVKFPSFVERVKAATPMGELLLPAIDKVMAVQRRSEVRMAMLLASIAVVESGPEKLSELKDPFGDGPFGYRKLETGFELSSKLVENGKPVTLTVGAKAKKKK